MRNFLIIISVILVFFSGLYLADSILEPSRYELTTIESFCNNTTDEYSLQECRIYEKTYRQCIREVAWTVWYEMCYADLSMTEYNIKNCMINF